MSMHEMPVGDGKSLIVPEREYEARIIQEAQRLQEVSSTSPINFFGFDGRNQLGRPGLGGQPAPDALVKEIKGWAAIAGAAVARRMRQMELLVMVQRPDKKESLSDHPLQLVFDRPNPIFKMSDMLWLTSWYLMQTGDCYWQKVRDALGRVVELWPIPTQRVSILSDKTDIIGGYVVRPGDGTEIILDRDDVIRFFDPDPDSLYGGIGRLGPQRVEYDADRFMQQHFRTLFENDATPRMAIIGKPEAVAPSPDQMKDFRARWRQEFNRRVGDSAGLPAFIPPGWDMKELSAHGGADELNEKADQYAKQLLAAYGVPGSIVGMVVDVNRAAAETNRFVFDINTIHPMTEQISEVLTHDLAKLDFDSKLVVEFKEFVSPDKQFRLEMEDQDLRLGVRSINQVRASREVDPVTWGELPALSLALDPYDGTTRKDDPAGAGKGTATKTQTPNVPREQLIQLQQQFIGPMTTALRDDPGYSDSFEQVSGEFATLRAKLIMALDGTGYPYRLDVDLSREIDEFKEAFPELGMSRNAARQLARVQFVKTMAFCSERS